MLGKGHATGMGRGKWKFRGSFLKKSAPGGSEGRKKGPGSAMATSSER